MPVIQKAYAIPDEIITDSLSEERYQISDMVSQASGLLKDGAGKRTDVDALRGIDFIGSLGKKVVRLIMKKNKSTRLSFETAAAGSAADAGIAYFKRKTGEPEAVTKFRVVLRVYIDEIRKGCVDMDIIAAMLTVLDEVRSLADVEQVRLEFLTENLDAIVQQIRDYTLQLAEDNHYAVDEDAFSKAAGAFSHLQDCLQIQKRIFVTAS